MKTVAVKVQRDHLERISTVRRPLDAVAELVWNSLDADADDVRVELDRNALGGIEAIRVSDNGRGIDHREAESAFANLGGSWKQTAQRSSGGRLLHGKGGEGRFRAFALGEHVEWTTTYDSETGFRRHQIRGTRSGLGTFAIDDPVPADQSTSGTEVTVTGLAKEFASLDAHRAVQDLAEEFALYLRDYPSVSIRYEGQRVDPTAVQERLDTYDLDPIELDDGSMIVSRLVIIEWRFQTERALVLCNGAGFALGRITPGIQAPGFNFTAYVKADYLEVLARQSALELEDLHPGFRRLREAAKVKLREHFRRRAAESSAAIVEGWKKDDVYPYQGPPSSPLEEAERQVFDVLALNVNSYLSDFEKSEPRSKRFSLRLVKEALQESPNTLRRIFADVLGLSKEKQEEFADLLERTSLAAVINASRLVADRLDLLKGLETLVYETREELRERDQLHRILADNTWVFGEEFNLSIDDESLDQVLRKHLDLLGRESQDDAPVRRADGSKGRVDLMLSRLIPQPRDEEREHLVVELKRPSQAITAKVAMQIESYAFAVAQDERFRDTKTRWVFWAISNELDDHVQRRARQKDRSSGIIHQDEELRITIWAKSWGQVLEQCRSRLEFFRKSLEYTATRESSLQHLRRTYEKYIPASMKDGGPRI